MRIHDDDRAAAAARQAGAHAYTTGSHIVFAARQFAPKTDTGARLLAHELVHVMQQTGGAGRAGAGPLRGGPVLSSVVSMQSAFPKVHEDVRKGLEAIVRKHPRDGEERVGELLALAASVPAKDRPRLHERLARPESGDAFAVYLRNTFGATRDRFLSALRGGTAAAPVTAETVVPGTSSASERPPAFVSNRYEDVRQDPSYIDNFINDINEAWFPNDRFFAFAYPGGKIMRIDHQHLVRALGVRSELNPRPGDQELRKKFKIPADLELPESTAPGPFITMGETAFVRDPASGVIYPAGSTMSKNHLPRIARAVEQIESVRADEELVQRNMIPLLGVATAVEWGAPRGMGSLVVRFGRKLRGKVGSRAAKEMAEEEADAARRAEAAARRRTEAGPRATAEAEADARAQKAKATLEAPDFGDGPKIVNLGGEQDPGVPGAVDINDEVAPLNLKLVRPPGKLIRQDMRDPWPIPDNFLDEVVGNRLPGQFPEADIEKIARETFRTLKPGGTFRVFATSNTSESREVWRSAFQRAGFTNARIRSSRDIEGTKP